ncbi:uncharacterized protein MONBRDRAFT_23848 [Monosiga brevicollis MX1]|uniref:Uncharacterized protein n=1 Tax=Monosiga brevicollis TaxID=81824 RepID=A9UV06_MONBE|nr:uncharacterized protein MONBRDRAFT_23848 [Monosiga brevicollis MX1]EDQ90805.1 predicted protein [Monosiga brevicollis MX1]|eukprot:XP_001744102.1 hypothetical protein [Monosiga brevicollis MX1]
MRRCGAPPTFTASALVKSGLLLFLAGAYLLTAPDGTQAQTLLEEPPLLPPAIMRFNRTRDGKEVVHMSRHVNNTMTTTDAMPPRPPADASIDELFQENECLQIQLYLREMLARAERKVPETPWWQDRLDQLGSTPSPLRGELGVLFATPIFRTNINLFFPKERVAVDNNVNNAFFERQRSINNKIAEEQNYTPEGFLDDLKEMADLKLFWRKSIRSFWENVPGRVKDIDTLANENTNQFFYWAAVNHHGIDHHTHVHYRAFISGVYYVKVPPLAGDFCLYDPRGFPQHPFHIEKQIAPVEAMSRSIKSVLCPLSSQVICTSFPATFRTRSIQLLVLSPELPSPSTSTFVKCRLGPIPSENRFVCTHV